MVRRAGFLPTTKLGEHSPDLPGDRAAIKCPSVPVSKRACLRTAAYRASLCRETALLCRNKRLPSEAWLRRAAMPTAAVDGHVNMRGENPQRRRAAIHRRLRRASSISSQQRGRRELCSLDALKHGATNLSATPGWRYCARPSRYLSASSAVKLAPVIRYEIK